MARRVVEVARRHRDDVASLGLQAAGPSSGDVAGTAARVVDLLAYPARAWAIGEKGLAQVDREWRWELAAARLAAVLAR